MAENNISLRLSEQWLAALQASGYRLTTPLRVLVEVLANGERALEPVELYNLGRREYPSLGLVTVYRTLDKLQELGLVQRVHQENGCHRYLRAAQGHEHVLLCSRCGRVVFFSGDDLAALTADLAHLTGFDIRDHWLQLLGVCADCQG
jgi:Fur family transcriptional regulator, ferric uptake regulator